MTEEFAPVLFVDLVKKEGKLFGKRPQRWRWVARNSKNFRVLATSAESFINKQDCLDSIAQVFGDGSNVYLREAEKGNQTLRMANPF